MGVVIQDDDYSTVTHGIILIVGVVIQDDDYSTVTCDIHVILISGSGNPR